MTELAPNQRESTLEEAQRATEWFADMIYGLRDDIPNDLPQIALQRLVERFNPDESTIQKLNRIRDVFIGLEYDGQLGFSLYFSGYPMDSLDMLVDDPNDLKKLIDIHFQRYTPARNPIENTAPAPLQHQILIGKPSDKVRSTPIGEIFEDEALMGIFGRTVESDLGWQAIGLCAETDPDIFFPEKGGSTREAKRVCSVCEVREQCLDHALDTDERFGIWGGKSERERRKLKQERNPGLSKIKVYLGRPHRVQQLLEAIGLSAEQVEQFSADQPRFARLTYTLLSEAYGDSEDKEEIEERLKLYFVTARKRTALEPIIDFLQDDLFDFFDRLSSIKADYQNKEMSFVDFYAQPHLTDDRAGQFAVSRFVRKRTEQEKRRAEEAAEESRVY